MFPFDLPGPQFLAFYALFASAVIATLYLVRRARELGSPPSTNITDPLLFACLRGGPREVVRVATLGLIDRGLLTASGGTVKRSNAAETGLVRRRIEKEVLNYFKDGAEVGSISERSGAERIAAEEYESQLTQLGLIPDAAVLKMRSRFLFAALVALLGVSGFKLMVALGAGRGNVWFLIAMMALAAFIAVKSTRPYRTALGDSYLSSVRSMFQGLRDRSSTLKSGSGSREVLWLTALFGVAALPVSAFPFVSQLWPRQRSSSSSGCGTTGGSGCGGGGGGGGGGGCGGCGS